MENVTTPKLNNQYIEEIDNELEIFHEMKIEAIKNNMPWTNFKTLPRLTTTQHIRDMKTKFDQICQFIDKFGHSIYTLQ